MYIYLSVTSKSLQFPLRLAIAGRPAFYSNSHVQVTQVNTTYGTFRQTSCRPYSIQTTFITGPLVPQGGGHRLPRFSRLINCSNKGEGGRLCLSYYYLPHRFSDLPTVLHQIICANHGESVKIDSIVWLTIFSSYSILGIFSSMQLLRT